MAGKQRELKTRIRLDGEADYKKELGDISSRMKVLNSELDVCTTRMKTQGANMDDLKSKQVALSEQYILQQDKLKILNEQLAKSNERYGENSRQSNALKAQINQTTRTMLELENSMDEADQALDNLNDTAKEGVETHNRFGSALASVGETLGGAVVAGAKAAGAALAAVGAAVSAAATELWKLSGENAAGMAQLAAQTGATGEEMQELGEIAQQVYRDNFGDNLETVAADLATVRQNTKLTGDALKEAAEAGYMLQDTFDMDQAESSRAAAAMMEKFGISAREAYNLIAVGAQKGANQNGDLLDVIAEYAPHYAAMGLSADQMMQTLINGAAAGVFQIDKVGDAMKEFSIRAIDGSEGTADAFNRLGLNAQAVSSAIAKGGPTAEASFQQVVTALQSVQDPRERNQIAVALFGTQYEDLGAAALPVLAGIVDTSATAADALGQINAVKYDTFEEALSGVKRQVESELLPLANTARQTATNMLAEISSALSDGFQPEDVQSIGRMIAQNLMSGVEMFSGLINENMGFVTDALNTIVSTVTAVLPTLLDTLLPAAMGLLQSVIDGLSGNIEPLTTLATNIVTSIAGFLIENAPVLVTAAADLLTGLVGGITECLPVLIPAAVSMMAQLATSLLDALPTLVAQLPAICKAIWDGLAAVDWAGLGLNLIQGLVNGLTGAVGSLLESIKGVFQGIWQAILGVFGIASPSTKAKEAAGFILSGLVSGFESAVDAVCSTVKKIFGKIWDAIKSIFGMGNSDESKEAKQAGKDIMSGMQDGITGDEEKLKTTIRNVSKNALKTFRTEFGINEGASTSTKLKEYGRAIVQGMLQGIDEKAANSFQGTARNTAQYAFNAFNSEMGIYGGAASRFTYIGSAICDGISNGIASGSSRVSAMARRMAQAAYNAAKRELDINSPSTKFEYLADMSIEGYTRGLNARMQDVTRSVQGLNSAVTNGVSYKVQSMAAQNAAPDYSALVSAMKEAGLGVVVLTVDGKELGRSTEPGVSQQQYSRAGSTVVGRSSRLVLV